MPGMTEFPLYLTFISIVFGVFIAVWVQTLTGEAVRAVVSPPLASPPFKWDGFLMLVRALLMFMILICLWWWYAIVLGKISPAKGFIMYFYDFVSLGSFAVAFRFWDQRYVFPGAVFFGGFFMFWRVLIAHESITPGSDASIALSYGVGGFILFFVFFLGAVGVLWIARKHLSFDFRLTILNYVAMALLFEGVVFTFVAARYTEGWFGALHVTECCLE